MYKTIVTAERIKYRTFWTIRWAIAMIDNSSIYDKIIYPSQAFSLPIKEYDKRILEETVDIYEHEYIKRIFNSWKEHYLKIRNK